MCLNTIVIRWKLREGSAYNYVLIIKMLLQYIYQNFLSETRKIFVLS